MDTTSSLYAKVIETAADLRRQEGRTGADWARDGYSIQAAQQAVDAARAAYRAAFTAYAATAA